MKLFLKHEDGTIEDREGNIVFFSLERFKGSICEGDDCFICGAKKSETDFNNEHVIPKWVLRKFDLYKLSITLPNEKQIRYDKYLVPCCQECNSFLSRNIEEDVRYAIEGGLESVNNFVIEKGPWKIFLWLSLIFLKTHLKDTLLRKHLDRRKGEEAIASDYDWGLLHHIHCMVRAIRTGAKIDPQCLGTLMILPAKISEHYGNYDYRDIYAGNTILLRLGDIAFLAVLDDSCAALNFFSNHLKKLTGPLSPIQLREVLSHLTLLNYKLKYRPTYSTKVDEKSGEFSIIANLPISLELEEHSAEEFGEILYGNVSQLIEEMNTPELNSNIDNVKSGNYHFLYDENGEFMKNSMEIIEIES